MSLSGALYTGLSGLSVNQQQMNVVGNNIANVNTVAFKSSRALFSPQFYVTQESGSAPDSNRLPIATDLERQDRTAPAAHHPLRRLPSSLHARSLCRHARAGRGGPPFSL